MQWYGTFIDGDALDEYYKFRTWGNGAYLLFSSQYETTISKNFFFYFLM
jgi:hypothetical protein